MPGRDDPGKLPLDAAGRRAGRLSSARIAGRALPHWPSGEELARDEAGGYHAGLRWVSMMGNAGEQVGGRLRKTNGPRSGIHRGQEDAGMKRRHARRGLTQNEAGSALALLVAVSCGASASEPEPDRSMVPGTIIDHSPASSRRYVGSPSIAVLPTGRYVASHDFFGPGSSHDRTRIHRSEDRGRAWETLTDIQGQFWSTLFVHREALYIIGTAGRYGRVVIRRSTDGGETWTMPSGPSSGLLLADAQYHCAPVPVTLHNGRIWRAMEHRDPPRGWGATFRAFVMSAPAGADLLEADSWTSSNRLGYDDSWPGGGWLEGNIVVTPEGRIWNILRNDRRGGGKAAVVEVSRDGRRVTFDPDSGFIDFPGGCKKFTIRYDPASRLYWSLSNWIHPGDLGGNAERTRNTVALVASPDLRRWSVKSLVLRHPDVRRVGFQYIDWLFDGDDIIAVSRTAFDDGLGGAHNCHDANYLTFHRIRDFRERSSGDIPLE